MLDTKGLCTSLLLQIQNIYLFIWKIKLIRWGASHTSRSRFLQTGYLDSRVPSLPYPAWSLRLLILIYFSVNGDWWYQFCFWHFFSAGASGADSQSRGCMRRDKTLSFVQLNSLKYSYMVNWLFFLQSQVLTSFILLFLLLLLLISSLQQKDHLFTGLIFLLPIACCSGFCMYFLQVSSHSSNRLLSLFLSECRHCMQIGDYTGLVAHSEWTRVLNVSVKGGLSQYVALQSSCK